MIKHLPSPSSVQDLKNQAEQLLQDWRAGDLDAAQRVSLFKNRSLPFFRVLLDKGADPNLTDNAGQTAFQLAAILGRKDVSDLLISRGANSELGIFEAWAAAALAGQRPAQIPDFSRLGRSQRDLVCQLAGNGQTVEVSALLNAGFPIDLGLWATPLHNACWNGRLETVRLLISQGAPLEATEPTYHSTPLGWTMHGSMNRKGGPPEAYVAIFEALIDAGVRMPSVEEEYWQEEGSASPEIREWLLARV